MSVGLLAPVLTDDPKNKIIFLPGKSACEECLISGVKYFFPVELGSYTRGIATSYSEFENVGIRGKEIGPSK